MAIGSSITGAHGGCSTGLSPHCPDHCGGECYTRARAGDGWLRLFADWLGQRWPVSRGTGGTARQHAAYNGGKGATHIFHFATCLESYLPDSPVHLYVLELTIYRECAAAFEGDLEHLIRKILSRRPTPAIILLRGGQVMSYLENRTSMYRRVNCTVSLVQRLAAHYGLLYIEVRGAWFRSREYHVAFADHENSGSEMQLDTEVERLGLSPRSVLSDRMHPSSQGKKLLADLLSHAVLRTCAQWPSRRDHARLQLPSLLAAHSRFETTHACLGFTSPVNRSSLIRTGRLAGRTQEIIDAGNTIVGGLLPPANVSATGFDYILSGGHKLKPGLVASRAGSAANVSIDARPRHRSQNESILGQPFVDIHYLRSYEHMGVAELACYGGCACGTARLQGHWTRRTSEDVRHRLALNIPQTPSKTTPAVGGNRLDGSTGAAELVPPCLLSVRVLNESSSGEHKFKLTGVTIGEELCNNMCRMQRKRGGSDVSTYRRNR